MIARLFIDKPGTYLVHPDDLQRLVTVPDATQEALDRLEAARILQPPRTDDDAELYGDCFDAVFDAMFEAVEFIQSEPARSQHDRDLQLSQGVLPALLPTRDNYVARRA